jgi:host factor-I protein
VATEFDTGLPSIRKLQGFIKDKNPIELKLVTGDVMTGKLFWQDAQYFCLMDDSEQQTLIARSAVVYFKAVG